jgi:hypothetical protein
MSFGLFELIIMGYLIAGFINRVLLPPHERTYLTFKQFFNGKTLSWKDSISTICYLIERFAHRYRFLSGLLILIVSSVCVYVACRGWCGVSPQQAVDELLAQVRASRGRFIQILLPRYFDDEQDEETIVPSQEQIFSHGETSAEPKPRTGAVCNAPTSSDLLQQILFTDLPTSSPAASDLPTSSPAASDLPTSSPAASDLPTSSPAARDLINNDPLRDRPAKSS